MNRLDQLIATGFDNSEADSDGHIRVRCSQCDALVINGHAAHETGCPNQVHECKGCNATVPRRGMYCEDCI